MWSGPPALRSLLGRRAYSRALELLTTLPRVEPAPDLVERAVARSRRAARAEDRVGAAGFPWVPVTAAAALVAVAVTMVSPWIAPRYARGPIRPRIETGRVVEPELRAPAALASGHALPGARGASLSRPGIAADPLAAVPDSMFDHSEDIEFILDPMTLHRGRPAVVRARHEVQGQQATITF